MTFLSNVWVACFLETGIHPWHLAVIMSQGNNLLLSNSSVYSELELGWSDGGSVTALELAWLIKCFLGSAKMNWGTMYGNGK